MKCPDCKDGKYVGLNSVEVCQRCGGTGHVTEKLIRKIIRIKAEDSPNVQLGLAQKASGKEPTNEVIVPGVRTYEEYVELRATKDKVWQCVALDADWYEGAENLLFPPEWLNHAETVAEQLERADRHPEVMGVDPGEGVASTVWCICDRLGIVHLLSLKTPDTSTIPGQTVALMNRFGLEPNRVYFDRGGGGKQHADRLRGLGYPVNTVAFGETIALEIKYGMKRVPERREVKEEKYTYKNRRAEMYGMLSIMLDPEFEEEREPSAQEQFNAIQMAMTEGTGRLLIDRPKRALTFGIPSRYTELRRQLAPVPKWFDDEGRLYLPPKNKKPDAKKDDDKITMTSLIGCSPDEADALVLAVYGLNQKPAQVIGSAF